MLPSKWSFFVRVRRFVLLVLLLYSEALFATEWAEVTASSLRVRSSPAGEVIGSLSQGETVEFVESQDGWAYIRYKQRDGARAIKDGWVSANYLLVSDSHKFNSRENNTHADRSERAAYNDYDLPQASGVFWVVIIAVILLVIGLLRRDSSAARRRPTDSTSPTVTQQGDRLSTESVEQFKSAVVKYVIDGDTVVIGGLFWQERIRLYAIDCPEDGQPWGDIATAGLIKLIGGKRVRLEPHGVDKYDRTLGTLYVWSDHENEWQNVSERMVVKGHAWVMRRFYGDLSKERKKKLNDLERWAKRKRAGLWRADNPVPPWQWRNQ